MSSIRETAEQFFDACETGKGWDGCQAYCHEGARAMSWLRRSSLPRPDLPTAKTGAGF